MKPFHPGVIRDRPQIFGFFGRKGSGKTTLCIQHLTHEFRGVYDKVILISPTVQNQGAWEKIDLSTIELYEGIDDRILSALLAERSENYKDSKCLVICDDLGEDLRRCNIKILNKLISNSRHLQLSMLFLHQKVTQMHPVVRVNCDTFAVFSSNSHAEKECLWREISVVERKEFNRIMNEATQSDYGYLIASTSKEGKMVLYDKNGKILS